MRNHSNDWHCGHGLKTLHACIATLCIAGSGLAHGNPVTTLSDDALEARFWACDVASTHTVLSAAEGAQCVRWQDELKQRRFGGDFGRLLDWWRAHKAEQHARRLPTATQTAAQR
ncbi:MAG TPA: hypothetical protein VM845_15770 [Burkholderiaceae bacterium]|jgi:hypothetical protein|nr:hypothetical protein [Burkholderiaceae bacterium]